MKDLASKECIALLNDNYIGNLGFIANGNPYIIPITYYYDQKDSILAYSGEGHKINSMRENNNVSLQVANIKTVKDWQSVLIHGVFEEMTGPEAKFLLHEFANGVKKVVNKKEHSNPRYISEVTSDVYVTGITIVYRIKIDKMDGKKMSM